MPPKKSKPPASKPFSKFVNVGAKEASRHEKVALTAFRKASKLYLDELWLTEDQRSRIEDLYATDRTVSLQYENPEDAEEQIAAASFLATSGLSLDARASLGNRWSSRWARRSGKKGSAKETCRELFQWYVMISLCPEDISKCSKKNQRLRIRPYCTQLQDPTQCGRLHRLPSACRDPVPGDKRADPVYPWLLRAQ